MFYSPDTIMDHVEKTFNHPDTMATMAKGVIFKAKLLAMLKEMNTAGLDVDILRKAVAAMSVSLPPDMTDDQINRFVEVYKKMATALKSAWLVQEGGSQYEAMFIMVHELTKSQAVLAQ
jgi:hypothetical protein